MTHAAPKKLLSVAEAAQSLGVSARFIRRLVNAGQVQVVRLGRRTLLHVDEVERLARDGAGTPPV